MGYFVKNRKIEGSSAITLPVGDTASRPSTPQNGQLRFNTDLGQTEMYQNGWLQLANRGSVSITKDTFTGTGSQTDFAMSLTPPSETAIVAYVGNVHQNPGVAYTVSSNTISFAQSPANGLTIEVYHGFASTAT